VTDRKGQRTPAAHDAANSTSRAELDAGTVLLLELLRPTASDRSLAATAVAVAIIASRGGYLVLGARPRRR